MATELPSLASVLATVQREETRRKTMNRGQEEETERTALATNRNPTSTDNRGKGRSGKQNLKCTHCNRNGHEKEGCWNLYPHLRPARVNKTGDTGAIQQHPNGGDRGRHQFRNGDANSAIVETSSAIEPTISISVLTELLQKLGQAGIKALE